MSSHRDDIPTPDDLAVDQATGDAHAERSAHEASDDDRAAAALQSALTPAAKLPAALRDRLVSEGEALVNARSGAGHAVAPPRSSGPGWLAVAACVALAGLAVAGASWIAYERTNELRAEQALVADLQERIDANDSLLADVRASADQLRRDLEERGATINEQETQLAEASRRRLELAQQLADATDDLELARLEIAKYEAPADPAELRQNRQKLLEVPGTVRLAWSPFQLDGAPPVEQPGVAGDVVWNDEREQGFLRFTGLAVNDPDVEQYQVWIIDERGMEQKVSGGVFNATAQGEVIVPIEPGIDVGRVALFAITVENPGGTWVPDLQRRVVVAPRG